MDGPLDRVQGCESTQLSGNPRVHTVFQSKSIDLPALWQIIPAALHMTQSAWQIAFWWAIGLLVYQPNHPLMAASRHRLHFSERWTRWALEISSYILDNRYDCIFRASTTTLHSFVTNPLFLSRSKDSSPVQEPVVLWCAFVDAASELVL